MVDWSCCIELVDYDYFDLELSYIVCSYCYNLCIDCLLVLISYCNS